MGKGLGKSGFTQGVWQDYQMCVDATKEVYRLQGKEWNCEEKMRVKHEIEVFNKYECLNYLRKQNNYIKKHGGNIIEHVKRRNKKNH